MLAGCTSWPQEFVKVYREKGYWEDITLWEVLERTINRYGDKEGLIFKELRLSYREWVKK